MTLLTLLWGASLAIALVSVLVVSLVKCTGGKRSLKTAGRVLLITAHPDDESMFFAPVIITLTQANVEIFLLCLSEGHFIPLNTQPKTDVRTQCNTERVVSHMVMTMHGIY